MTEQAVTETIVDITSAAKGANFLPWLIAPLNNLRKNSFYMRAASLSG
jgi:hypothetical protein